MYRNNKEKRAKKAIEWIKKYGKRAFKFDSKLHSKYNHI